MCGEHRSGARKGLRLQVQVAERGERRRDQVHERPVEDTDAEEQSRDLRLAEEPCALRDLAWG